MMRRLFIAIALCLLPAAVLLAQAVDAGLDARIRVLERDLEWYKQKYERLDELFQQLAAVTLKFTDVSEAFAADVRAFLEETKAIKGEINETLTESRAVIDYLRNKVIVRPTFLIETELSYRVLLGGMAGVTFVWEPLPWLAMRAGAELWYTDAFRPAFPVSLVLRFRLD